MYICKIRHLFSGRSSNIMFWPIYRTTGSMFFLEKLAFIGLTFARFWRAYWSHANMTLMLPRAMEPTYKYIYIYVYIYIHEYMMNMAKITNSPSGVIFSFRNHAEQILQWLSRPLRWLTAFRWQSPHAYVKLKHDSFSSQLSKHESSCGALNVSISYPNMSCLGYFSHFTAPSLKTIGHTFTKNDDGPSVVLTWSEICKIPTDPSLPIE